MTIHFVPLQHIASLLKPEPRKGWEEMVALGMDDLELARLNQANTRDPDSATCTGMRFIYSGGERA